MMRKEMSSWGVFDAIGNRLVVTDYGDVKPVTYRHRHEAKEWCDRQMSGMSVFNRRRCHYVPVKIEVWVAMSQIPKALRSRVRNKADDGWQKPPDYRKNLRGYL